MSAPRLGLKKCKVCRIFFRKAHKHKRTQKNSSGTSKVGAISKAQKAQKTFFEKLEIFEFFSFRKCRIVPKMQKGGPLGFINIYSFAKYKKLERGTLLRH